MFYEMNKQDAKLMGKLNELAGLCTIAWRGRRVYFSKFYGGRFVAVFWKPWAAMDKGRTYIVPLDTVANAENLRDAIAILEEELREAKA